MTEKLSNLENNREVIIQELKAIKSRLYEEDKRTKNFENHHKIVEKAQVLQRKYPDFAEYELWHLLVGSTLMPGHEAPYMDFPGEDSVEAFLRSL